MLSDIIQNINLNSTNAFDNTKFTNYEQYVNDKLRANEWDYLDHGADAIVFSCHQGVVKIVVKKHFQKWNHFVSFYKTLQSHDIPILEPSSFLYEDENIYVYSQNYASPIKKITHKVAKSILDTLRKMIKHNTLINNMCIRNFRVYMNKLCLIDFHTPSNLFTDRSYIAGIAEIMTTLNDENETSKTDHTAMVQPISKCQYLLDSLSNYNFIRAECVLQTEINKLERSMEKRMDIYQSLRITSNGDVILNPHMISKYDIVELCIKMLGHTYFTLIDAGCCIGGVGLKIAQTFPHSYVCLNNVTKIELDQAISLIHDTLTYNVHTNADNIMDIDQKYNIGCYFSLFHHLLLRYEIDTILSKVVSQCDRFAIIEVPLGDDFLLRTVIKKYMCGTDIYDKNRFTCLSSKVKFFDVLEKYFDVVYMCNIKYPDQHLQRYAFICKNKFQF